VKRTLLIMVVCLVSLGAAYYCWSAGIADPRRLGSANGIEIRVSSGRVEIIGDSVSEPRVSIDDRQAERSANVRISREREPTLMEISGLPRGSHVEIEVPKISSVSISMGAGDLHLSGVQGDIYALLRSGSLTIDGGESKNYHAVTAFVLAGELDAPAFRVDKGGIWRTLHWVGPGRLRLDAYVTSGQIILK
jgi:hypothetical protein